MAWYWAAVVGDDRDVVAFRAHDIPVPARDTEVRASGVWAALICETPYEHWSVGLESFGVAYDDPLEAWRSERGDVVPFGLDLEWEAAAAPVSMGGGYDQWCVVHGEVLIGDERIDVDATGSREHSWGAPQGAPLCRVAIAGSTVDHTWTEPDVGPDGLPRARNARRYSPVLVPGAAVVHALCYQPDGAGWATWWL